MNPIKNRLVDSRRWQPGALIQDNGGALYKYVAVAGNLAPCTNFAHVSYTDALLRRLLARIKR